MAYFAREEETLNCISVQINANLSKREESSCELDRKFGFDLVIWLKCVFNFDLWPDCPIASAHIFPGIPNCLFDQ